MRRWGDSRKTFFVHDITKFVPRSHTYARIRVGSTALDSVILNRDSQTKLVSWSDLSSIFGLSVHSNTVLAASFAIA